MTVVNNLGHDVKLDQRVKVPVRGRADLCEPCLVLL